MGTGKDMKATAKNIEGKVQETTGNITGDKKDQLAGKVKQAQASGEHAVEKIRAGAKLVQMYTGLIYKGPALVTECAATIRVNCKREAAKLQRG